MTVEAIPSVGVQIIVLLEEGRFLPAFLFHLFEGTVLAVAVVGKQVDVATHTADGAGVVESHVADIKFFALTKVSVFQVDAC